MTARVIAYLRQSKLRAYQAVVTIREERRYRKGRAWVIVGLVRGEEEK